MNKKDRQLIFDKFGGRCAYCGCELNKRFQVDHVIPVRNFRVHVLNNWRLPNFLSHLDAQDCNHMDNLFPTCQSCNNYKRTNDLELFRSEVGELITRLNKRFNQYMIAKRYGLVTETGNDVKFYFETYKQSN